MSAKYAVNYAEPNEITNPAILESVIIPNCTDPREIMGTITQSLAPIALRSESRLLCPVLCTLLNRRNRALNHSLRRRQCPSGGPLNDEKDRVKDAHNHK